MLPDCWTEAPPVRRRPEIERAVDRFLELADAPAVARPLDVGTRGSPSTQRRR